MQPDSFFFQQTPKRPTSQLGGVQNDIFFSVMKVIHRQPERLVAPSDKVARLSCVCRISELMPLVRQLHDDARARYQAQQGGRQRQQAA
ncbi:hypothetical protein [Hymenobacter daeguensis]